MMKMTMDIMPAGMVRKELDVSSKRLESDEDPEKSEEAAAPTRRTRGSTIIESDRGVVFRIRWLVR